MEYVKSEKGKEKLLFEGFVYVKQKNLAKGVVSFECEKCWYSTACKAKVKYLVTKLLDDFTSIHMDQIQPEAKLLELSKKWKHVLKIQRKHPNKSLLSLFQQ